MADSILVDRNHIYAAEATEIVLDEEVVHLWNARTPWRDDENATTWEKLQAW